MKENKFLTAEWRKLVMANYVVDPSLLKSFIPFRTELDYHEKNCYVSLVGFMFLNTRVLGISIPFHKNFEEVNLRFYVRYKTGNSFRRGVVFIKEIVPRHAITFVANKIYGEKYETMPMKHYWSAKANTLDVGYFWKKGFWNSFGVIAEKSAKTVVEGSEEDFITNHFWGYTRISDNESSEYEVTHPTWEVYPVISHSLKVDFVGIYGKQFSFLQEAKPYSVLLAEGSEIEVRNGRRLNEVKS
jgi:uncharacterized protein